MTKKGLHIVILDDMQPFAVGGKSISVIFPRSIVGMEKLMSLASVGHAQEVLVPVSYTHLDPSYMVYYYDHKGDKWIDYAEYAELNGYTVEDVFYEYKAETGNDYFSDASSLDNQGLIFFFNSRGELEFRESIL